MVLTKEELVLTNGGGVYKYVYVTTLVYNVVRTVLRLVRYLR